MGAVRTFRAPVVFVVLMSLVAAACSSNPESATTTSPGVELVGDEPTARPPDPAPIMAFLWHSGDSDVVVGQPIQFTGEVLAHQAIASVELWIDGELVGETVYDEPVRDPLVTWRWIPLEADLSFALMRVYDETGGSETTYPVWVRSHPIPTDLDTSSPDLAVGASFSGGDAGTAGMAAALSFAPAAAGFGSFPLVVDEPSCTATLTINAAVANLAGYQLKASTFGMSGFTQIGLMGPSGGTVTIPVFSAPTVVTADAYTADIAVPLPPSKIPGLSNCAAGVWSGDVKFAGSRLVGADNIDRAYLYLTTDGLHWERYPEADGVFVEAGVGGGFDFAGMLPKVPLDSFIEVEVWGWNGGTLVGLGRGRFDPWKPPPPSSTEMDVPFGPSGLGTQTISHLSAVKTIQIGLDAAAVIQESLLEHGQICAPGSFDAACLATPVRMRWLVPTLPSAEHGLIQVSTLPPPTGPAQNFPGLMASALVATDGDTSVDFSLNHVALIGGGGSLLPGAGNQPLGSYDVLETMTVELNTAHIGGTDGFSRSTNWKRGAITVPGPAAMPKTLWVRVIPFRDNKPMDGITNTVKLDVITSGPLIATPLQQLIDDIEIVEGRFYRPSPGNPGLQRCVRVVANPFLSANPVPDYILSPEAFQPHYDQFRDSATLYGPSGEQKIGLVKGSIVCAKKSNPPSKTWFEYVVDGVNMIVAAWDSMIAFINELKSDIISGVVKFTGCAPKDICLGVITALVDVALASAGVPPTLPSFDQLMQSAKGDLATMVATAAVNTVGCGGVLDAQCKKWAEDLVEEFLDEIQTQVSSMAVSSAQSGGYYLWLHPDIKVIPEPAGQLFPGSVTVSFRMPASAKIFADNILIPQDTACQVVYSSAGFGTVEWVNNQGVTQSQYFSDVPLFNTVSTAIDLRDLEPDQVVTVALASSHLYSPPHVGNYSVSTSVPYYLWGKSAALLSQTVDFCGTEITETFPRPTGNNHPLDYPTP